MRSPSLLSYRLAHQQRAQAQCSIDCKHRLRLAIAGVHVRDNLRQHARDVQQIASTTGANFCSSAGAESLTTTDAGMASISGTTIVPACFAGPKSSPCSHHPGRDCENYSKRGLIDRIIFGDCWLHSSPGRSRLSRNLHAMPCRLAAGIAIIAIDDGQCLLDFGNLRICELAHD